YANATGDASTALGRGPTERGCPALAVPCLAAPGGCSAGAVPARTVDVGATSEAYRAYAPAVAGQSWAAGWAPPRPARAARPRRPAFEPARNPSKSELWSRRAKRWLVIAFALATLSLLVIATTQTFWVPLVTGQLGYLVAHRFWTPIFIRGGFVGLALSFVAGS